MSSPLLRYPMCFERVLQVSPCILKNVSYVPRPLVHCSVRTTGKRHPAITGEEDKMVHCTLGDEVRIYTAKGGGGSAFVLN